MGCATSKSVAHAEQPSIPSKPKYQIAPGNYASVTKITIKPEDALTAANLLAAKVPTFMSWEGVVAVHNVKVSESEMWFVGVYADAAALEANADNVKAVLGEFGPMMGAPPDRVVGAVHSVATGITDEAVAPGHAAAVTKIAIAPDKFAEAEAVLQAKLPEFASWAGLVSFVAVQVSDELLACVAVYKDEASLAANADNVKAALGALGPLLASPPAREAGVVTLNGDGPAVPEAVAFFFDGEQMAPKAEAMMGEHYAESHVLSFIGPYAPPVPPLDKAHLQGAMGNLIASFPDLTFNFTKVRPAFTKEGGFAADIVVMGTHTGAAFSPMPGKLPAIEPTGKQVKIGPETFTLYADASGKVTKTTIEPLHEGAPAGPPGFYTEIGGVLPAPAVELPPSPTKAVPAASAA